MGSVYNTKQKQLILSCLNSNKNKVITVNEIQKYLESLGSGVGITTIYRYLDSLEKANMIRKISEDNIFKYQIIDSDKCQYHYHLKCNNCGKLIHLECNEIDDFNCHIVNEHGFKVDNNRTIIYGVCKECEVNNEKN